MAADNMLSGRQFPPLFIAGVIGLQCVLTTLIVIFIGTHGWDDGVITLAYSRTFAETSRIALTAVSEQVEGFSSLSWFLLNALAAVVFNPDFARAILISQLLAAIFITIGAFFIYLIARRLDLQNATILAILIIFTLMGPAISEIANGMEMTLLTAAGLAIVYLLYFNLNWSLLLIAIILFLTARFEAMIYYAFLLSPLLLRKEFRKFVLLALFGLLIVGLQEWWRYVVFGDWLPNTIHAKMHPPYISHGFSALLSHCRAPLEIIVVFLPVIVALVTVIIRNRHDSMRTLLVKSESLLIISAPIMGAFFFAFITGKNWGYNGRMQFLALPFALLLCGMLFEHFTYAYSKRFATIGLLSLSVATILWSWPISASVPLYQIVQTAFSKNNGREHFGVTPASYRLTGLAVDRIRELAGLSTITFMTPDVGGSALCCDRIRIVDIGLLTNRFLAREGYQAIPEVLTSENPDVIELHQIWAEYSGLYSLPDFLAHYHAVLMDNTRLYLRNDHVQQLLAQNKAKWCYTRDNACREMALKTHRYLGHATPSDDASFLRTGRFLLINDPGNLK